MKPFEGLLGNNVELRIIEFLLPFQGVEFNISDLGKEASVSRTTADKVVKKFVEWGFMEISRTDNTIKFYKVNEKSPIYQIFVELDNRILELMLTDEELYEIHDEMQRRGIFTEKPDPSRSTPLSIPIPSELNFDWKPYLQVPTLFEGIDQGGYQNCNQITCDTNFGGKGNAAN